jgi:hypothetical protein
MKTSACPRGTARRRPPPHVPGPQHRGVSGGRVATYFLVLTPRGRAASDVFRLAVDQARDGNKQDEG